MRDISAIRATVPRDGSAPTLEATMGRARELGVTGWVREGAQGSLLLHAEGDKAAIAALLGLLSGGTPAADTPALEVQPVAPEGHEQFAIRGVSAGAFVVQEHQASAHHFDLRLEVDGSMRSWALPKGPSLDPAVKRLAVEVGDHGLGHNTFEGMEAGGAELDAGERERPGVDGGARPRAVIVWDHGTYEQGGRVPWPEALARGHAVFVLHGEKLRGGFALQRTRPGTKAQWLLIKRRDEEARPGSDVVTELPRSVISGRTLEDLLP